VKELGKEHAKRVEQTSRVRILFQTQTCFVHSLLPLLTPRLGTEASPLTVDEGSSLRLLLRLDCNSISPGLILNIQFRTVSNWQLG